MMTQSERFNLRRSLEEKFAARLSSADHHFEAAFEYYLEVLKDTDQLAGCYKELVALQERIQERRDKAGHTMGWTILGNVGADVERTRSALNAAKGLADILYARLNAWQDGNLADDFRLASLFVHGRLSIAAHAAEAAQDIADCLN